MGSCSRMVVSAKTPSACWDLRLRVHYLRSQPSLELQSKMSHGQDRGSCGRLDKPQLNLIVLAAEDGLYDQMSLLLVDLIKGLWTSYERPHGSIGQRGAVKDQCDCDWYKLSSRTTISSISATRHGNGYPVEHSCCSNRAPLRIEGLELSHSPWSTQNQAWMRQSPIFPCNFARRPSFLSIHINTALRAQISRRSPCPGERQLCRHYGSARWKNLSQCPHCRELGLHHLRMGCRCSGRRPADPRVPECDGREYSTCSLTCGEIT